jgi:SAM-dependent methyltransferase
MRILLTYLWFFLALNAYGSDHFYLPEGAYTFEDGKGRSIPFDIGENIKMICVDHIPPFHAADNHFGDVYSHGFIQPEFVEEVLKAHNPEILEVGAADGPVLKQLLTDPRNDGKLLRYTIVEISENSRNIIKKQVLPLDKNLESKFFFARNGDIREYIKIAPDTKKNKFDFIFCAQLLHYFNPLEQLECFQAFYDFLKPGGKLFFIQNSIFALSNWSESAMHKENIGQMAKDWSIKFKNSKANKDV